VGWDTRGALVAAVLAFVVLPLVVIALEVWP
jgi:hypothetical protein